MANNRDDKDEEVFIPQEKGLVIFGRDISKIPCFRNSFLYGMGGGITLGLGHFMFNSRPLAASNFAVYSFSLVTLAYWIQCRYRYSVERFKMMQMQELMKQRAIFEGTNEGPVDV